MFGSTCSFCGGLLEAQDEVDETGMVRMYRCPFCMREERYIIATQRFSMI